MKAKAQHVSDKHVPLLLVRHYYAQVKYQGHLTEGAIKAAGQAGKRLIYSVLHKCVTCCRRKNARTAHGRLATGAP